MGNRITICEVGPRDGFQNVPEFIASEVKREIIEGLINAGIPRMQITSFVNPKAVPQMRDATEIASYFLGYSNECELYALAANRRGVEDAYQAGIRDISYVTSVTDGHNYANVRRTVAQSIEELRTIIIDYPDIDFCWDVSMAFGCSFDGTVSLEKLLRHIESGLAIGLRRFNLCDSIGIATPNMIEERITALKETFPEASFSIHVHDTRNMGMLNSLTAIRCGITHVETSVGGLGGCPFSPGATGNTSTEDMVYMLNEMGYETGVDFEKVLRVAKYAKAVIPGNFSGHHININAQCRQQ